MIGRSVVTIIKHRPRIVKEQQEHSLTMGPEKWLTMTGKVEARGNLGGALIYELTSLTKVH